MIYIIFEYNYIFKKLSNEQTLLIYINIYINNSINKIIY